MKAQCSLHTPYVRHWPFQTRYNRCITVGFALSDGEGNDCTAEFQGFLGMVQQSVMPVTEVRGLLM